MGRYQYQYSMSLAFGIDAHEKLNIAFIGQEKREREFMYQVKAWRVIIEQLNI